MNFIERLNSPVRSALSPGHIGAVVFVRWTVLADHFRGGAENTVSAMATCTSEWFGGNPRSLLASVDRDSSSVTVLAEFANCRTALLTAATAHGRVAEDFVMLGNEGALYGRDLPEIGLQRLFDAREEMVDQEVLRMVQVSLKTGERAEDTG